MDTMLCLKCQAENPSTAKFCFNCGTPLTPAPSPQADMATLRLEPEPSGKNMSTIRLTPEEVAAAAEPQVAKPGGDSSTLRLTSADDAQAAPVAPPVVSQDDFSTKRLEPVDIHTARTEKMDTEQEAPPPSRQFCHNCGALVKPGLQFCDNCGAKLDLTVPSGSALSPVPPKRTPPAVPPPPAHPGMANRARPPERPRRFGWVVVLILLCLLAITLTVLGVLYQDQIKDLFGIAGTDRTPEIEVISDRPTVTTRPTSTVTLTPTITPTRTPTVLPTDTTTPTPLPRTLTICIGSQPDTLFPYGGSMLAMSTVLEAIYDGPIDSRSYTYQAVILEKLPSLADGDAFIGSVTVRSGDWVVDDNGDVISLSNGARVRPSGCRSSDCAVTYTSGTVEMDQLSAIFTLLPDIVWSDGEPLTAYDSLYSYQLTTDPDTPIDKYVTDRTQTYEALDDLSTIWTGLPGYLDSTYFTNFYTPYPEHLWGGYSVADLLTEVDDQGLWLGWGPYIIDDWVVDSHISLYRNPLYFRSSEGLPHFEYLTFRFVGEDANSNIASLLSGECDIVDEDSGLDGEIELLLQLEAAGQLQASIWTGTTFEHADFNIRPIDFYRNSGSFAGWDRDGDGEGPFGDIRLRQAIAMCLDRQAVVDTIFFGQSIVIDTYIPPEHPLYDPGNHHWPYDPAAASELLDQIGWLDTDNNPNTPRIASGVTGVPNGTLLQFNYNTTTATQRQQATQILAESAITCGIQMDLGYYPASEWFADGPDGMLFGRHYDLGQFAWLTSSQPPCDLYTSANIPGNPDETDQNGYPLYPYGWGGQNNTGYANPYFDSVCDTAYQSLPGEDAYFSSHLEAQTIIAEELPTIPLYLRIRVAATRPDMCNFIMDSTANNGMWNIEAFDWGDHCP